MKILLPLFCLLFLAQITQGQISKGNVIIEGSSGLSYTTTDNLGAERSQIDLFVSPYVGVFITDRMVLGGQLFTGNNAGNGGFINLIANGRYYFEPQEKNAWFLDANLGIRRFGGASIYNGNFGLGLDLFLTPFIAFENKLSIGFEKEQNDFAGGLATLVLLETGLKFFLNYEEELEMETQNWALQAGTLFLGVSSANIQFSKRTSFSNYYVNISPKIGKFIKDNLLVGGNLTFSISHINSNNYTILQAELSPFVRYYHAATNPQFALFVEGGGGLQITDETSNTIDFVTQKSPLFFGGIGLNYFIRPMVAVEIKGSYKYTKIRETIKTKRTGLDIGFQFFLSRMGS